MLPDGVWVKEGTERVQFVPLPPPSDADIVRLLRQIGRAVEKRLRVWATERWAEDSDDTLSIAQQVSVTSYALLPRTPDAMIRRRLCAAMEGYSLHAQRPIDARLISDFKYISRRHQLPPGSPSQLDHRLDTLSTKEKRSLCFLCAEEAKNTEPAKTSSSPRSRP